MLNQVLVPFLGRKTQLRSSCLDSVSSFCLCFKMLWFLLNLNRFIIETNKFVLSFLVILLLLLLLLFFLPLKEQTHKRYRI
jgi:hypothetical protein